MDDFIVFGNGSDFLFGGEVRIVGTTVVGIGDEIGTDVGGGCCLRIRVEVGVAAGTCAGVDDFIVFDNARDFMEEENW